MKDIFLSKSRIDWRHIFCSAACIKSYSMFSHFSSLDFSFYLWWAMSASCLYSLFPSFFFPFLSTICLN